MSSVQLSFKPKAVSKKLLSTLNPRTRAVIVKRYGLEQDERKTLESIGKEYGITRERVRQIENFALSTIRKSNEFGEHENIFTELAEVVKTMGMLVPESILMNHFSNDKIVHNHMNFFMSLSDRFTKHKEDDFFHHAWSIDRDIANHIHDTLHALHNSIDKEDLLKEEEVLSRFVSSLTNLADEYKNNKDVIDRYLKLSKIISKNPLNEWGHVSSSNVKARGIKDYAYLILRQTGSPMHFRDVAHSILKVFNKKAHVATCHNELIKDKRFVLLGRGMYGLREWGQSGGTVKEIIKNILTDAGEKMHKDEIIEKVKEMRDVKENTVMVNLNNSKYFKKLASGFYTNK
jgi:hypothetical protein